MRKFASQLSFARMKGFGAVRSFQSTRSGVQITSKGHLRSFNIFSFNITPSVSLNRHSQIRCFSDSGNGDSDSDSEKSSDSHSESESGSEFDSDQESDSDSDSELYTEKEEIDISVTYNPSPKDVLRRLEESIVGQQSAKKAVSVALRNRWRSSQLKSAAKDISPSNILMVGSTGSGKSLLAKELSEISSSPFVKAEATNYTEVGFHGRDVDKIIEDLVYNGMVVVKELRLKAMCDEVAEKVQQKLMPAIRYSLKKDMSEHEKKDFDQTLTLEKYLDNELDDLMIKIHLPTSPQKSKGIALSLGGTGLIMGKGNPFEALFNDNDDSDEERGLKKKMTVKKAKKLWTESFNSSMGMSNEDLFKKSIELCEGRGIVFIDEVDKLCNASTSGYSGANASCEGVQRDLLPLVEGSVVKTKYGDVDTKNILFICAGSFHGCEVSDLLPEFQGRLPIRVELDVLTEQELFETLKLPNYSIVQKYVQLLQVEDVEVHVTDESLREIARVAKEINSTVENIGARRLSTVVEKVFEDLSFAATKDDEDCFKDLEHILLLGLEERRLTLSKEYVVAKVGSLVQKIDLQKFIL